MKTDMPEQEIRFDEALNAAVGAVQKALPILAADGESVLLIRDLTGRFRVFVDREAPNDPMGSSEFERQFSASVGAFAAEGGLLFWRDGILAPHVLHESPEAWSPAGAPPNLRVIDRLVTGREWLLASAPGKATTPPRLVFFGIKGGVGRTTALAMLAWHLSTQGKNVLVVDLNLESPGLAHSLLPDDGDADSPIIRDWPEFGVVDWLVEDLVGQADSLVREGDLWARSPLSTQGDIWVVPAMGGRRVQDYIGKLSRAYVDVPVAGGRSEFFGDRIARFVDVLEDRVKPDVVLLDSRAGLHDISSALLTRLDAWCLLFAVDARQTWEGLRILFRHWQRKPEALRRLRLQFLTVAAMVPEDAFWPEYRREFCEHAFDVFQEIYDEIAADIAEDANLFTFAVDDPDAPHWPTRIERHGAFDRFAPLERRVQVDETKVKPAFGDFLNKIDLILAEQTP